MRNSMWIAVVAVALMGCLGTAPAQDKTNELLNAQFSSLSTEYDRCVQAAEAAIPAGDPAGVTVGPLTLPAGGNLRDLMVGLEIEHRFAGDLSVRLDYDSDNDGAYDAGTLVEFHWVRPASNADRESWSCPVELDGVYYFEDEEGEMSGNRMGTRNCETVPDADATFSVFDGMPSGGSFYLTIVDEGEGSDGKVSGWAVYVETLKDSEVKDQSATDGTLALAG